MNVSSGLWCARGRVPSWVGALCVLVLCTTWSGAYADPVAAPGTPPPAKATCPQLNGLTILANKIGLPTTGAVVTSTTQMAASGSGATATGSYCLVAGAIHPVDASAPDILFNIALPDRWNDKILKRGAIFERCEVGYFKPEEVTSAQM